LGEGAAAHLGIAVQRMKNLAILTVAAATGAAVAVSGGIVDMRGRDAGCTRDFRKPWAQPRTG